jgi:hypothetical protein
MKRRFPSIILSGLFALDLAFSVAAAAPLRLDIDDSGRYALVDVVEKHDANGIEIAGAVKKRGMASGKIRGDVNVDLLNQDGKVIASRDGALTGFGPSTRNPNHGHFTVAFAPLPRDARALRVYYHPESGNVGGFLMHMLTID